MLDVAGEPQQMVTCEACDHLNVEVEFYGQTASKVIDAHGQLGFSNLSQTATYLATVGLLWLAEADPNGMMAQRLVKRLTIPVAIVFGYVLDRITN